MTTSFLALERSLGLRVGEEVEVRSAEEIFATLDENGALDSLPFMPEMLEACGRRFRVYKRAHKTCDTIHKTGIRQMDDAVHLEGPRCDGSAHGGCQANCLFFWKEAWLKRVGPIPLWRRLIPRRRRCVTPTTRCSEARVRAAATRGADPGDGKIRYSCQTTRLFEATRPLAWWNPRPYVEDVTSGNFPASHIAGGIAFRAFESLRELKGHRLWMWLYDRVQRLRGALPYPAVQGRLKRTPAVDPGIEVGTMVRVRPAAEIEATLDESNKNRGLYFDREMIPYCGGTYRVIRKTDRIIDERTGEMVKLKDCLMLDGVVCKAYYSDRRIGCPRAIYSYWRQQWLEPVGDARGASSGD